MVQQPLFMEPVALSRRDADEGLSSRDDNDRLTGPATAGIGCPTSRSFFARCGIPRYSDPQLDRMAIRSETEESAGCPRRPSRGKRCGMEALLELGHSLKSHP